MDLREHSWANLKFKFLFFVLAIISNSLWGNSLQLTQIERDWIQRNPQITLLVEDLKPLSFINHRGEVDGILRDYMDILEDAIGVPGFIRLNMVDSKNQLHAADVQKVHGFAPIVHTPLNQREYFLSEPFIFSKFVVFANKSKQHNIHQLNDLAGKKVAILKKHRGMHRYFSKIKGIQLVYAEDSREQLNLLQYKKVDAVVGYSTYHFLINEYLLNDIIAVYHDNIEFSAGLGIHKKYPVLFSLLNKASKIAITTRKRQEVLSRWLDNIATDSNRQVQLTKAEKQWIKDHPVLTVGESLRFQPLMIRSNNGEISGIIPELFNLIGQRLGIKFQYEGDNWATILRRVENKQLDMVGAMNRDVALDRGFIPVDSPVDHFTTVFALKNRNFEVSRDTDIHGLKIAYFKQALFLDRYLKQYYDEMNLVPVDSPLNAFKAVIDGKADVMIGLNIDRYLLSKNSILAIEPIYTFKSLQPDSVVGVRSDYPILASMLEKAIASISVEERDKVLSRWSWVTKQNARRVDFNAEEQAYLNENPVLTVQNLMTFPPFNFYEHGEPKGYTVEYLRLMAEQMGVDVEFISGKAWHETLQMMKDKTLDVIPHIAITEERLQYIDYTDFNHIEYTTGIAVKKDSGIRAMSDLKNKVIAVTKKTFLHSHLKQHFPEITLLLTATTSEAVHAVAIDRADAALGSLPSLDYFILKNWLSNVRTLQVDDLGMSTVTALPMGVAKGNHVLSSILSKVNAVIPQHQVNELRQKWMNTKPQNHNSVKFTKQELHYLKNKPQIKMCIDPDWMPLEKNENGMHIGMSADYFDIFQKSIQSRIVMVPTQTWRQSIEMGKKRKCDIFSMVMTTPEREKYLSFTKPYLVLPLTIATKVSQPFINDIPSIVDKPIGIVSGYAYNELFRLRYPEMKLVEVDSVSDGLEKVRDGELFGFIDTLSTLGYSIQKKYIGELKIAGKFDESLALSVGVRNDEPLLKNIFDKVINTISRKQHQIILNRWVSVNFQQGPDYHLIAQVTLAFLLIISLILYRNRSVESVNNKLKAANKANQQQQQMVDKYVLILTTDLQGVITDANEAFCRAIGYSQSELIGRDYYQLCHPEVSDEFLRGMWGTINNNKTWIGEIKNLTKHQETIYFNLYIEPVYKDQVKVGYRSISEDITDKKRIEELSITDKLTGLYNRLKLDEILLLEVEKHKRYQTIFSVIILDIDNFKAVNDTYGHDVGDCVLKHLASILKNNIRHIDFVGRWGGEEFVLVCENTQLDNAFQLAENLRKKVAAALFDTVGQQTISLGVTEFTTGDTLISVFKRADEALYEAKHSGKNKTVKKKVARGKE